MRPLRPSLILVILNAAAMTALADLPNAPAKKSLPTPASPSGKQAAASVAPPTKLQRLLASVPKFYFWPSASAPSQWSVSAGYTWRNLGELEFHSFSNGIASGVPFLLPAGSTSLSAAGTASGFSNRAYDDGFVNPDNGTAITGDTTYWGYTSASQSSGDTISFHGDGPSHTDVSQNLSLDTDTGWSDRLAAGGPIVTLSFEQEWSKSITLGIDFSVSLLAVNSANVGNSFLSDISMDTYTSRVTDSYSTGGGVLPPAPYTGSLSGPGPLIFATPTRSKQETLASQAHLFVFDRIEESLDLTLTTLSLGPTASMARGKLHALLGYGLALNIASWDALKRDTVYAGATLATAKPIAQWRDAESGTDVLPGLYLQSSLRYDIDQRWSCSVFGRYDWSRKLKGEVGDSTFALDLSGWSTGATLCYKF